MKTALKVSTVILLNVLFFAIIILSGNYINGLSITAKILHIFCFTIPCIFAIILFIRMVLSNDSK